MKRKYESGTENNVKFFIGNEVENGPAFALKTLFVVGLQDVDMVLGTAINNRCQHIYFGANHSFPKLETNNNIDWNNWERMIKPCLGKFPCTLDLDASCVEGLLESGLTEFNNFIPMISVKLPYIQQLGYNAIIKLDDTGFDTTNPGVWTHQIHDLQTRESFTPWSAYTKDSIIK